MVLRKKENYTIITPIPSFIPRQLALDILHSHSEVITLNPLVLSHKQIKAPRDAAADEFFSTWYEITERVQIIPGVGKLGSSKISFNACFHDLPWGLQTHVYAPLNIDMRSKYRIGGNQPGVEPPEASEIGLAELGAPKDGLYLREDIEIRCNITMVSTVKTQMKQASKDMVDRIIKKAELLDSGVLQAMIEDGKLSTFKPLDRSYTGGLRSPQLSPSHSYGPGPGTPASPTVPYQVPRPISTPGDKRPGTAGSLGYPAHWQQAQQQQQQYDQNKLQPGYAELPTYPAPGSQSFPMELPGDFHYPGGPQQQQQQQSHRNSSPRFQQAQSSPASVPSTDPRWSQSQSQSQPHSPSNSSRPTSYSSDSGFHHQSRMSPSIDQKASFASELPTHRETREEGQSQQDNKYRHQSYSGEGYPYNPADYARH